MILDDFILNAPKLRKAFIMLSVDWVKEDIRKIVSNYTSILIDEPIIFSMVDYGYLRKLREYISKKDGIIVNDDVPTAAISKDHMWMNPVFWMGLTQYDKEFVLHHEIMHLNLLNAPEWRQDPLLMNIAQDLFINLALLEQPYGIRGKSEVSLALARKTINYITMRAMISDICDDISKSRKLVDKLKMYIVSGFQSVPIYYSFLHHLARECGRKSIELYAKKNFVLYNDVIFPLRIKGKLGRESPVE